MDTAGRVDRFRKRYQAKHCRSEARRRAVQPSPAAEPTAVSRDPEEREPLASSEPRIAQAAYSRPMSASALPTAPAARPYIGGQAVLEGVMMRAPTSFAVVVRRRDGSLLVRERPMRRRTAGCRAVAVRPRHRVARRVAAPRERGAALLAEHLDARISRPRSSAKRKAAASDAAARRRSGCSRALGLVRCSRSRRATERTAPAYRRERKGARGR